MFVVFFSGKHFGKEKFFKLIVRFEISSKNHIFRYKYFRVNKWGITSKLKKKSTSRFFGEKNFEKKIKSQYHNASEISPVTLHTHTYRLFFKNRFFSFLGSQNVLICQKIKISPKTMVPLWGTKNFYSIISIYWSIYRLIIINLIIN